ncbi:MAG: hypothetical protein EXS14_04920 [Planctomycetes bacterium]|nr:hypothetical protein [Planctomycetota bacterium]
MSRLILFLLLLALSGLLLWHLLRGDEATAINVAEGTPNFEVRAEPMRLQSSMECAACHAEVVREWQDSWHSRAYTDPEVQALSKGFQDKDCLPCHLPRPVLETGLSLRPLERDRRHDEGVDCFTCHFAPEANSMIGRGPLGAGARTAPCQPQESAIIGSLGLCAPCHNQHKVHEEWKQTSYALEGANYKDCNDCHMPQILRASGVVGRSHRYPGAHDTDILRRAATLAAETESDGAVQLVVSNTGAGHNFPTDERHRAVDLEATFVGKDGSRVSRRVDRYRNPYRTEFEVRNLLRSVGAERDYQISLASLGSVDVHVKRVAPVGHPVQTTVAYPESTQIPAGESRRYKVFLPPAVESVTFRLYYRTQPFQTDADAVLLHEATVHAR